MELLWLHPSKTKKGKEIMVDRFFTFSNKQYSKELLAEELSENEWKSWYVFIQLSQ